MLTELDILTRLAEGTHPLAKDGRVLDVAAESEDAHDHLIDAHKVSKGFKPVTIGLRVDVRRTVEKLRARRASRGTGSAERAVPRPSSDM